MSKSKRMPAMSAGDATAGRHLPRLFFDETGKLKTGWWLVLAVMVYVGASMLLRLGLNGALSALFRSWRVDASNIHLAPGWARRFYAWHGSLVTLVVSVALIPVCACLRRWWLGRDAGKLRPSYGDLRHAGGMWMLGTLTALQSAVIFLLVDSLRMEWALSNPNLTPGLMALWLLNLIAVFSEELFTKGVVLSGLRNRWGSGWALLASTAVFFLANGGYAGNALCAVNVTLLGAACGLVCLRYGFWASTGLRWGWSFAVVFLLGFGGGGHSVYRLYGVSESLITGGDAGFVYGLWMTLLLVALLAWLLRTHIKAWTKRV